MCALLRNQKSPKHPINVTLLLLGSFSEAAPEQAGPLSVLLQRLISAAVVEASTAGSPTRFRLKMGSKPCEVEFGMYLPARVK